MATETYQTQLERVQAQIAKIEEGFQSYSIAGRSASRARLEALYEREKYLRTMAARESRGGGIRVRGVTPA